MFRLLEEKVILIVDDMPLNLMILEQVLQTAGANVVKAGNGEEALQLLEDNPVEIILTDLQMPVMDGWEMAAHIRQSDKWYRQLPIIATTSEMEQAEMQKCLTAGINEVFIKPINPATICQKILEVTGQNKEPLTSAQPFTQTQSAFSLSYLKEVTNGDTESIMRIVENLQENAPLLIKQSIDMVHLKKWKEVGEYLHKLKGLVALFEMHSTTQLLKEAEQEAKTEAPSAELLLSKINFLSTQLTHIINEISSSHYPIETIKINSSSLIK